MTPAVLFIVCTSKDISFYLLVIYSVLGPMSIYNTNKSWFCDTPLHTILAASEWVSSLLCAHPHFSLALLVHAVLCGSMPKNLVLQDIVPRRAGLVETGAHDVLPRLAGLRRRSVEL